MLSLAFPQSCFVCSLLSSPPHTLLFSVPLTFCCSPRIIFFLLTQAFLLWKPGNTPVSFTQLLFDFFVLFQTLSLLSLFCFLQLSVSHYVYECLLSMYPSSNNPFVYFLSENVPFLRIIDLFAYLPPNSPIYLLHRISSQDS